MLAQSPIHLFITATNVRTGRGKVFKNEAVTPDVLLASACLPTMFQAIEIDGEAYWDGGYSGNPTLTPLVRECKSHDTILVPINPIERPGVPRSASEILNRLNEVSFNAVILKELRMMALLRKVADPGDGEGRLWEQMRVHHVENTVLTKLGASSKLNAEWPFFTYLRDEGRKVGAGVPRCACDRISASGRRSTSTSCSKESDAMGLLGILVALGLLIWLAYRGWSILLLAPAAAILAAALAGEPLLAHWTQTFMASAAQFVMQFFPIFLLGALFGKLMEDSGSVSSIAKFMTERLGHERAVLAVVLAGAIVTYGGVSLFVAFFVIAPMAHQLFRSAAIPRRLMPAAIALGTTTFTMSALPGTPAIQNAIPMPFFGTTPFAAPGLGIIAAIVMFGFGMWWLGRAEASARAKGEGYGDAAPGPDDAEHAAEDLVVRERATTASTFDPPEATHGRPSDARPADCARGSAADHRRRGQSRHVVLRPAAHGRVFSRSPGMGRDLARRGRRRVGGGDGAGGCDRRPDRGQLSAPACAARQHGRRGQRLGPAGGQRREPGRVRLGRRRAACVRAGARLGARHRGRGAGVAGGRDQCARCADRLGLGRPDDRARRAGRQPISRSLTSRASTPGSCTGSRSSAPARSTACRTTARW